MIHTTSTPARTKSLRHKREAAVKSAQSASNNDDKVLPVMKDVGTWTPSRKQQSSLEHLKSKFAAKSSIVDIGIATNHASMDVNVLPWQQFSRPMEQHQLSTAPKDYTIMLNELNVTHAVMAASQFESIDFAKAEQLVQKFQHLHQLVDAIYGRIRIQTDTQRAAVTAFKLDQSSAADFIQDICQSNQQATLLVDEFYFTSQSAHRTETRYLEHLAGTLATAMQQQCQSPQEDIHRILTKILVKLESTASYFDDTVERQHVPTLTSTSTSSTSSSSSTSSISSSSAFTQANSVDTSPSTVYIPNEDTPTSTLHQKIENVIDKLARQLKQKQELLRVMEIQSNTHEELARQRERSASLVLELERSRSKRLLIAKKQENDMIVLRDQLMQETMRRQSLQDRVTSLEHTLKSKEAEISKLKSQPPTTIKEKEDQHTSCQIQIQQLQQELQHKKEAAMEEETSKEKEHLSLQQQLSAVEQRNTQLEQTIKEQHERELAWSCQKKHILDQCQQVLKTDEFTDCEGAVVSTIAYLTERQQEHHGQKSMTSSSVPEESHLQHQLTRLQQEFDQAKQTFTTRESAFILQSASTEAELERILKEYDRLTRNIVDFNNERKKFEDEIYVLHQDKQLLEKRICDDKVSTIRESSLRKEFRSLMASVKDKHTKAILQELEKQKQLEQELRDIKSDIEMKRWEKVDVAVQTHYFDIK